MNQIANIDSFRVVYFEMVMERNIEQFSINFSFGHLKD